MLSVVGMRRRTFIRGLLGTAALAGVGTAYAGEFERHGFQCEIVPLRLGLAEPLRVALLSDIHFDPLYETGYLESVYAGLAATKPDLVVYTGDFVTHSAARFADFGRIAASVRPPLGAFASLGNHDHYAQVRQVERVLEASDIQVLRNAIAPLPRNAGWFLAGLDSFWAGRPNPAVLDQLSPDARILALVHEPDAWDVVPDPRIRLQLSGHTHGGQVRLPLVGALELPTWGKHYDQGLFERDGRFLYVNRGIGTVTLPVRVNCPPEITIFELT
jgi:predicted MPP superfamily phosphohydrolase